MDGKRKVLSRIWLVIEVLYLLAVLYLFGDTLVLVMRGLHLSYTFFVVALAILIPGALLVKGYLDYGKGRPEGRNKIFGCAAASAVLFGLRYVPGLNLRLLGVSDIPGLQTLNLRILNLTFGPSGPARIFVANLIAQAVLPVVLVVLCEGFSFSASSADNSIAGTSGSRVTGQGLGRTLLRVAGTVAAIWAGYAATVALAASRFFDHSWIIVGFVPIPGQILLALPMLVALAVIIVIWTRPWDN